MRSPFPILLSCAAAVLLSGACESSSADTPSAAFPDAPVGATVLLHVAADCDTADADADGSPGSPYRTIGAALTAATPGTTILVAPGIYEEALHIEDKQPLTIVGASDLSQPVDGGVVLRAPGDGPAVFVIAPGDGVPDRVALHGLRIESPATAGIWAHGAAIDVTACSIVGARALSGAYGFGVLVTGGADLRLTRSAVAGSALVGVHVADATATLDGCTIEENAGGGVRADRCAAPGVVLTGNRIADNTGFGVGIFSSRAQLLGNTVSGTIQDTAGAADGLVASALATAGEGAESTTLAPSDVDVGDETAEGANTFDGNGRAGLLLDAGTTARILGNVATGNERAGIWLQGGAGGTAEDGAVVRANRLEGNTSLSVGLTGGSRATVTGNDVGETQLGVVIRDGESISLAYDVGVFNGSWAAVLENRFSPIAEAGSASVAQVLADDVADGTLVQSNTVTGSSGAFTIVSQALEDGVSVDTSGNEGAAVVAVPREETSPYEVDSFMRDGLAGTLPQGAVGPGGGVPD